MDSVPAECLIPPPAIYDHAPTVAYSVEEVNAETLRAMVDLLGDVPDDWIICGATVTAAGETVVFLLKDLPEGAARNAVLRHERGHVNGWEH